MESVSVFLSLSLPHSHPRWYKHCHSCFVNVLCCPYKGVFDCMKTVLKEEVFGAFYASYRTTILMITPFMAVHLATYEAVKRRLLGVSSDIASGDSCYRRSNGGGIGCCRDYPT
ncbi:hypothetical protein L6452_34458 [Arctium lappa]|uniref:Uncharacterized protein n=1 Tax=Arctium lappa TaxID=4217 RepID=A0ACB8YIA9_ARCLA|nr:hypothetical protein L6452_34458 [Arctium lappa]